MTPLELSIRLFVQFAVLLTACRLVGRLVRPFGQPQVVAEMITGVLLGPSLLGLAAPGLQAWLFPKESLVVIYCLAQVGLVLYMFLVGLDFDLELVRHRMRSAVAVSWAGILAPFALGGVAAWLLGRRFELFTPDVATWEAMLFTGAAMSITAFPMLARIIRERGLAGTSLGTLALAAGSLDDAAAWCFLAIVLASFSGKASVAILAVGGGTLFAVGLLTVGRKAFEALFRALARRSKDDAPFLPLALVLVTLAAATTDALGVYAVFGAFLCGAALPRGLRVRSAADGTEVDLRTRLEAQIGPLTTTFLLPMFFVNSGLQTKLSLLASPSMLLVAALLLLVAIAGKGLACAAAARFSGEPPREALAIGALMNARGLMELILLNIGYERGVITQTLFSVLVVMAIVTTLMAVPLFDRVYGKGARRPSSPA